MLAYPAIDSEEFCNLYEENHFSYEQLFEITKQEMHKEPVTSYFLSQIPDGWYVTGLVEEPSHVRMQSSYFFESDDAFASVDYFFTPCFFDPHPTKLYYHDQENGITIDLTTGFDYDLWEVTGYDVMIESVRDLSFYTTHEKWLNLNNQTVYLFPESSDTLTDRGYVMEELPFLLNSEK